MQIIFFLINSYILLWFTIGFRLWLTVLFVLIIFLLTIYAKQFVLHLLDKTLYLLNIAHVNKHCCFTLTDYGQCQFSDEKKSQISPNSQINLWGYWLVFTDNTMVNKFVFKDSLSAIDQARIGRTINRVKQFPSITNSES